MSKKTLPQKNIILYVMGLPNGAVESIRKYEKETGQEFRIMLLWDSKVKMIKTIKDYPGLDILEKCDFSRPHKIASTLLPYQDELKAITCRSESNMLRFAKVVPHVPYLRAPSTESLKWSTDKYEMRKKFKLHDPKNTPKFTKIKENSKKERERIIDKVGFPMVVKPTNLAQSLLVSICYHEEELEKALRTSFRKLKKIYGENSREEAPNLIAEEYMDGNQYSLEAYVNGNGVVYFCPMVKVVTGRDIGHDDFYNYMHLTPTILKSTTIERAQNVAETGIHALGLRNTTAHVELMKVDDEWKLIEIGPRVGGFRHKLHELSCDIDHSMNDALIHFPKRPIIPKKCNGHAVTLKWFPKKEGLLTKLKGIKKIQTLESFHDISVKKKIGDRCHFAKNGGLAVFTVTLSNTDRSKLLADIRRIEQGVDIQTK